MKISWSYKELNNIIITHIQNKGFDANEYGIEFTEDGVEIEILDEAKPFEPIKLPTCPKVRDGSYPRCISLSGRMYCNRTGGVCQ